MKDMETLSIRAEEVRKGDILTKALGFGEGSGMLVKSTFSPVGEDGKYVELVFVFQVSRMTLRRSALVRVVREVEKPPRFTVMFYGGPPLEKGEWGVYDSACQEFILLGWDDAQCKKFARQLNNGMLVPRGYGRYHLPSGNRLMPDPGE